jgi:acetyl esterase/lipase/glycerophosphoryl diester phosphodiesterase
MMMTHTSLAVARRWPLLLALCGTAILLPPRATADEALVKRTYTYKTVGDIQIRADVYCPDDGKVRPVVVWLHGGALIMGSRSAVPNDLLALCRLEGYVLVSFDYRLAPEVKLPAILDDLRDAFHWLREQGPKLFHADLARVAVTGGSAGGYLTLMAGVCVRPQPQALVAYWGYGDVDGAWYTQPSAFYRKQPLVSKEEAERAVGGKVFTDTEGGSSAQKARGRFYLYLRQNGLWTQEVTGFDAVRERARLDPYCPVRNVTADYPPTLLVHGTEDTDVPYEQSAAMAKELARHKVAHELVTVPGAGHGLAGGDRKQVEQARRKALAFLRAHLRVDSRPAIVGHRGLMQHAPENTLAGFAACLELGLGFELDVRRTRDGQLVCLHDADVRRTTDGKGAVSDLTLAELRRLDAGNWFDASFAGLRVPTLEELFSLARERGRGGLLIALDIKVEGVETDMVRLASKYGVLGRIVCIGRAITEPAVRRKLRQADPATPIAVLAPTVEDLPAALADPDADWVYIRFVPTAAQVEAIHRAGKRVFLSGPAVSGNEPANWRLARDRGVDALLTDSPLDCRQSWRGGEASPRPKGLP